MKKMLKSLFLLSLVCALLCGAVALGETAEATEIDFSAYPESFIDWDANFLASYLRGLGLDEDHMVALCDAMEALAAHFEIEPDFLLPPVLE